MKNLIGGAGALLRQLRRITFAYLAAFAVYGGLITGMALSAEWNVQALVYGPIFVGLGALGALHYQSRYSRPTVEVGVSCGACGWTRKLEHPDQGLPAIRHHIEFECPALHGETGDLPVTS